MALELEESRDELQDALYQEVEDMCDQGIITKNENKTRYIILSATPLRIAIAIFGRTLMPAVLKIYYIYQRNQQFVVDNVRHHLLPTIIAFLANSISGSLASVQKRISYPRKEEEESTQTQLEEDESIVPRPEPSVECHVLSAPEGPIRADVIFIHGLHGGVDKTWKQGRWRHDRHKLKHQAPVRRQSTGNLHVPPRNHSLKRTFSDMYTARTTPNKIRRQENQVCVVAERDLGEEDDDLEEEQEGYSNCWPQDWIPKDCPGVRVIAINYTTDLLWCPVWKRKRHRTDMVERSDEMIQQLIDINVGEKPIIWVGHSKGGLFIKQILLNTCERHQETPKIYNIFQETKGIMFYSVPHKGSTLADVTLPLLRRSVELIEIQRNCDFVLDLHTRFLEICKKGHLTAEIFSFIETSFTLMSFIYLKIVAYESADPDIGIKCDVPLDHREICKPAGRDCFLYLELIKLIQKYNTESTH